MKAFILAGGRGLRLMPITERIPKPLIRVGGRPIIEWQIAWLRGFGINEFVVSSGYLGSRLKKHIGTGSRWNVSIEYSEENEPLGTGGALRNAKDLLDGEFLVSVGDIITNIDIRKMRLGRDTANISLTPLTSQYGVIKTGGRKVLGFEEKPVLKTYWRNAGIYLMGSTIFRYLPRKGDMEKATFPLLAKRRMLGYTKFRRSYLRAVDSIKDIEEISADLSRGKVRN